MIRHHALLTLNDDAKDVADTIVAELIAFGPTCPEILTYQVGRDIGATPGTADVAVVAEFETLDNYRVYAEHPEHLRILNEHIRPNLLSMARVQTETRP